MQLMIPNDADLYALEMTARANLGHAARKSGRCPHYSLMHTTCPDCGLKLADDRESWSYAMACAEERECWSCGADATTHDGRCESCPTAVCKAPAMFGAW